jgi:hypothetical protein
MTNANVIINNFKNNNENNSRASSLSYRNGKIYSYDLKIGESIHRYGYRIIFLYNYTAKGVFRSMTTSTHVCKIKRELYDIDFRLVNPIINKSQIEEYFVKRYLKDNLNVFPVCKDVGNLIYQYV